MGSRWTNLPKGGCGKGGALSAATLGFEDCALCAPTARWLDVNTKYIRSMDRCRVGAAVLARLDAVKRQMHLARFRWYVAPRLEPPPSRSGVRAQTSPVRATGARACTYNKYVHMWSVPGTPRSAPETLTQRWETDRHRQATAVSARSLGRTWTVPVSRLQSHVFARFPWMPAPCPGAPARCPFSRWRLSYR